mgnify:FL=1
MNGQKINTSRSVAAMIAIGIINIITVPLIGKLGSQSAKNGYLFVSNYLWMYICGMPFLLLCEDEGAGDNSGKGKNIN